MKNIVSNSILFLLTTCGANIYSQSYIQPNIALKSHETLAIIKVEITPQATMIWFSVENRRDAGGSFCADKNINIIYPDGSRLNLTKAHNMTGEDIVVVLAGNFSGGSGFSFIEVGTVQYLKDRMSMDE
jgi:hypothetical protein